MPAQNAQPIDIAFAPFRAITAIRVYDRNDVASLLASSTYRVSGGDQGGRLLFNSPPPTLGEHTHSVLAAMGYSDSEIERMSG